MIDLLRRLMSLPADAPPDDPDARVAVAVLLVEAANADDRYEPAERERIEQVLTVRYALDRAAAAALRTRAEAVQAEAVDLVRFTRAVKDAVPHADRIGVIEAVWEVIYADGTREMHESALVRKLCGLLHIQDRDAGLARQRVARRLGVG